MQQVNCINMTKEQLLSYIDEKTFAIIDMKLYYDTHPNDKAAASFIIKNSALRYTAMDIYSKKYGPLSIDFIDTKTTLGGKN